MNILRPIRKRRPRITLIVSGSIAVYKALDLVRQLSALQVEVYPVMSKAAQQFVTPLSFASLSGNKVYSDMFSLTDEQEMGHIRLARDCDAVLVSPATADIIGKCAHGLADDLPSTILLATDKPVFFAPAMNVHMWSKPSVRRNIEQLRSDGAFIIEPEEGILACGEEGTGRMASPQSIINAVQQNMGKMWKAPRKAHLVAEPLPEQDNEQEVQLAFRPLTGMRAIVTSGPTREAIDPVRYISNHSSGKQGHAIARELAFQGADVTLICGPTSLQDPAGCRAIHVESGMEMYHKVMEESETQQYDVAICAAAVSDWRVADIAQQKIKKPSSRVDPPYPTDKPQAEEMSFTFEENPDILAALSKSPSRPTLVIGFAAETEFVIEHASIKRTRKGCDWIVANDVSDGGVFGGDENTVHLITETEEISWPKIHKDEVARRLCDKIAMIGL